MHKLNEDDNEDHNGFCFDGATLNSSVAGIVASLEADFGFAEISSNDKPAIVINNQNSNAIDININFSIETLIENATIEEEKSNLRIVEQEIEKADADWSKLTKALNWILKYSKDLSLKVLPIILNYYLKRG